MQGLSSSIASNFVLPVLSEAVLSEAVLSEAVLSEAVLSEAVLSATVLVFDGCLNCGDAEYEKKYIPSIGPKCSIESY